MRELCVCCEKNPRAVNYKKGEKTYYRRLCDPCLFAARKQATPLWKKQGYKKKSRCESCDFAAKYPEQLSVCDYKNSWRTVCLNCEVYIKISNRLIKKNILKSDF